MKFKTYLKKSEAFVSGTFDHKSEQELELKSVIEQFIQATHDLDVIKKHKYYGKELPTGFRTPLPQADGIQELFNKDDNDPAEQNLHAIIGICTEAGELLEAIYKSKWKGEEFDEVNAKEEIGDIFWYKAILFRNYKWNIKSIWERNIEKLTKRYGDKFSAEKAINRDLQAEREILEKKD